MSNPAKPRRFDVPCTVEIEQTPESLHAYVTPEGVEIGPGDRVLVHGAPSRIGYGERVTLQCHATVTRAGMLGRFWAHVSGLLSLVELYEVGFEPKECT
ncbi:hypothetical protein [Rhodopila sp.]|uniref:hypothetical protein n=1 Tax=Rhodopila sp. TaxID=2480087 RepID=UPI003D0F6CCD